MLYCVGEWYVPIWFEEKYAYADDKATRNNHEIQNLNSKLII